MTAHEADVTSAAGAVAIPASGVGINNPRSPLVPDEKFVSSRLSQRGMAINSTAAVTLGHASHPHPCQTILSVVIEVEPKNTHALRAIMQSLSKAEEATTPKYERLKRAVSVLHFISMTVFEDAHHDPVLVIEVNFDGAAGPFWAQLEVAIGPRLRDIIRCCKRPRDVSADMFDRIVAKDARLPVAPFLEARTVRPAVGHQGNRGLTRERIEQEAALFQAVQAKLEDQKAFFGLTASDLHAALRQGLLQDFPWLRTPASPRITGSENRSDWLRLLGFGLVALLVIAMPAILAWLLLPGWLVLLLSLSVSLIFAYSLRKDLQPQAASGITSFSARLLGALALLLLTGLLPTILGILCWLRWLEKRDPPQEAPPVDEDEVRRMSAREDRVLQNHMGSIVLVKPGLLRAVLIRAGLWGLGLLLRVLPDARRGYLSSMRTIHFAHWALISNGGRLMFFSNFDGTWESYLDDFIEKAHGGLTLAWCNCVGFPPTRFLWFDGATNGRRFKAWARHSMAASDFWFSAYPDLTVEQIERQHEIAEGLRQTILTGEEASKWAYRL
jgi:hypothetical protein